MRVAKIRWLDAEDEVQERLITHEEANWQVFESGVTAIWDGQTMRMSGATVLIVPTSRLLTLEWYKVDDPGREKWTKT